jgi:hypothetical protein
LEKLRGGGGSRKGRLRGDDSNFAIPYRRDKF